MGAETVTLQQFPTRALEAYSETEFARLDRKLAMFRSLPEADREILPEFESRISAMTSCVDVNARLLARMAETVENITSPTSTSSASTSTTTTAITSQNGTSISTRSEEEAKDSQQQQMTTITTSEDPKLALHRGVKRGFSVLASDWSETGKSERDRVYTPVLQAVDEAYEEAKRAMRSLERETFRVLVPGAGSGRLAWELARRGFCVEGCEESFIQLLVGNFVMNNLSPESSVTLYPYVHEHSNVRSREVSTRAITIPDVNPKDVPATADFTMRAARFIDAYDGHDPCWDAVVSFKAFDVAEHCLEHARRVAQIVKPGGVWISVGPSPCVDGAQGDGVHISAEEFVEVVRRCGFKIIKCESLDSLYSSDESSLRTIFVECPFIVAVKVRPLA